MHRICRFVFTVTMFATMAPVQATKKNVFICKDHQNFGTFLQNLHYTINAQHNNQMRNHAIGFDDAYEVIDLISACAKTFGLAINDQTILQLDSVQNRGTTFQVPIAMYMVDQANACDATEVVLPNLWLLFDFYQKPTATLEQMLRTDE